MLCGTVEPECRQRKRVILSGIAGAAGSTVAATRMPAAILISADDAPDWEATKVAARATMHPGANGAATHGRQLLQAAAQTSVGAYRVTDRPTRQQ